jgi:predicted metal-dependent HD superfamily phosphohydrolase
MTTLLSSECIETLKAAYAAPHRFYHTWHHVEALVRHTAAHPERDALYLACVFHDAVYDVLATDNEQRSAALMYTMIERTAQRDKAEECTLLCLGPFEAGESLAAYAGPGPYFPHRLV